MLMGSKISEEDLKKVLTTTAPEKTTDPKKRWVERMVKSAKKYHKICPYFDKKLGNCFIKQLKYEKTTKCDRDGKFEGCPVFIAYLEEKYDQYKSMGGPLPMDFRDLTTLV